MAKTEHYTDPKTGKARRRSPVTKNARFREMLAQCVHNQIPLSYVLADTWFASAENMRFRSDQVAEAQPIGGRRAKPEVL